MAVRSYSLRKRLQQKAGEPEVYVYDKLPDFLRHQIAAAFDQSIGYFYQPRGYAMDTPSNANRVWQDLDQICRTEIWPYAQSVDQHEPPNKRFLNFLLNEPDIDEVLSAIEFGAKFLGRVVDRMRDKPRPENRGASMTGQAALLDINRRFIEHGIGYQIENYEIIRIDSKLVHVEVIKPTLALLLAPMFSKANEDFMTAHRHYRAREYKDCVTSANRSFERILKAICDTEDLEVRSGRQRIATDH